MSLAVCHKNQVTQHRPITVRSFTVLQRETRRKGHKSRSGQISHLVPAPPSSSSEKVFTITHSDSSFLQCFGSFLKPYQWHDTTRKWPKQYQDFIPQAPRKIWQEGLCSKDLAVYLKKREQGSLGIQQVAKQAQWFPPWLMHHVLGSSIYEAELLLSGWDNSPLAGGNSCTNQIWQE